MQIDKEQGVLLGAIQVSSPNHNERPLGMEISLLVVHNISLPPAQFGGPYIDHFFTNTLDTSLHPYFSEIVSQQVSAHCLIRRTGDITQYVPFHKRAWHAGASQFEGRANCNDYSIGIELEGTDTDPYTEIQYQKLAALIISLQAIYPGITRERVVGHSTIAPERKTDPGLAFDWSRLAQYLQGSF